MTFLFIYYFIVCIFVYVYVGRQVHMYVSACRGLPWYLSARTTAFLVGKSLSLAGIHQVRVASQQVSRILLLPLFQLAH